MWAEVYGTGHLGAIRALATALGVCASALAPVAFGQLLDHGVTIDAIALGSAVCLLAATGPLQIAFARQAQTRRHDRRRPVTGRAADWREAARCGSLSAPRRLREAGAAHRRPDSRRATLEGGDP